METHDFEKLIGKNAYIIWDFTCAFFKTKGNDVYLVLGARDDYVQLQKGLTDPFWALCSHIDDAYIRKESEDVQYKSVPLATNKSVDTVYIESGKIEPRAFGLNLEQDIMEAEVALPLIKPKEKLPRSETRKSRAHLSKPRIKQKDGLFLCHFGVKYVPGIHAVGKGATIEEAYHKWLEAHNKMKEKRDNTLRSKGESGMRCV